MHLCQVKKGKTLPDSEMLWHILKVFNIPYALLLKDKQGLACEISYLLQHTDESKRKDIQDSIESIHKLFC